MQIGLCKFLSQRKGKEKEHRLKKKRELSQILALLGSNQPLKTLMENSTSKEEVKNRMTKRTSKGQKKNSLKRLKRKNFTEMNCTMM